MSALFVCFLCTLTQRRALCPCLFLPSSLSSSVSLLSFSSLATLVYPPSSSIDFLFLSSPIQLSRCMRAPSLTQSLCLSVRLSGCVSVQQLKRSHLRKDLILDTVSALSLSALLSSRLIRTPLDLIISLLVRNVPLRRWLSRLLRLALLVWAFVRLRQLLSSLGYRSDGLQYWEVVSGAASGAMQWLRGLFSSQPQQQQQLQQDEAQVDTPVRAMVVMDSASQRA